MSGAFETAAGAFAVVGVVDVVIRTGREIFAFLSEVKDAPSNIEKLLSSINDTVQLSQAAKACLRSLDTRHSSLPKAEAVLSLESAIKALNRELQSLKGMTAKFRGSKTWSRVKYVLNNAKVDKAIRNLESNKLLLSGVLTLACSELSACGQVETVQSITSLSTTLCTKLDTRTQEIKQNLDAHHQSILAIHTNEEQKIVSTLKAQHSSQSKQNADANRKLLSRLSSASLEVIARQKELRRLAKQNSRHNLTVDKRVELSTQTATRQHENTKESISILTSEIMQLRKSLGIRAPQPIQYHRNILFFGEHRDMIIAYLLPLQSDLDVAIESLIVDHGQEISVNHVHWLQMEFRRLIASAAQESATRFPESTATPIDEWHYPIELNSSSSKIGVEQQLKRPHSGHQDESLDTKRRAVMPRSHISSSNQMWSTNTPSGDIHISIPPARSDGGHDQTGTEVGLSCMITQNRSTFAVNARFRRVLDGTSQPNVQTQLSVFNKVEGLDDVYWQLFHHGTIAEIDFAYRHGTISPFHVDNQGFNYYFNVRVDALVYLYTHGIRTSQIIHALDPNKEKSFLNNFLLFSEHQVTHNLKMRELIEHINEEVTFSATTFADTALTLSIQAYARRDWGRAWPLFVICIEMLQKQRPDLLIGLPAGWLNGEHTMHNRIWEYVPPKQLLSLLFNAGADNERTYTGERNAIEYFMFLRFGRTVQTNPNSHFRTDADFLSALIAFNVSCTGAFVEARLSNCWDEWCEALKPHGNDIADAVDEGYAISFLEAHENRSEVNVGGIVKRKSKRTGYYYTDDEDDDEDDDWDDDDGDDDGTDTVNSSDTN
ncbi:hypothetical protein AA0118_g7653 [Alternaria tenuissima]|nr:hypothetical protein AA0118_g7653 [Alternaria tenuissima]